MSIPRAVALVLVAGTGVIGAYIGRAVPHDTPSVRADVSAAPSGMKPVDDACEAERSALASMKTQLDACMTVDMREPDTAPPDVPKPSEPEPPAFIQDEFRSYHDRLESLSEAVIVRHADGTIGVYKPDEWPLDGNGLIIGRKFPDGQIGRYAGPDAGPRSDPAAFRPRAPR
jgi:hypothetical protein